MTKCFYFSDVFKMLDNLADTYDMLCEESIKNVDNQSKVLEFTNDMLEIIKCEMSIVDDIKKDIPENLYLRLCKKIQRKFDTHKGVIEILNDTHFC